MQAKCDHDHVVTLRTLDALVPDLWPYLACGRIPPYFRTQKYYLTGHNSVVTPDTEDDNDALALEIRRYPILFVH